MPKKKLIIIILAPLLLAVIFLLIRPAKKTTLPPVVIPLPSVRPFSGSLPGLTDSSSLETPVVKTAAYFQLATPDQTSLKAFFSPLAQDFGFIDQPQNSQLNRVPRLLWMNGSAYLDVNLTTGQFNFKPLLTNTAGRPAISLTQALDIAKNFFQKYRLLNTDSPYEINYLKSSAYETHPVSETDSPDIFRFYFYPLMDRLPVFSSDFEPAPAAIDITKQVDIFQVNYRLPALAMANLSKPQTQVTLKSEAQIKQEAAANKAVIASVKTGPAEYVASTTKITNAQYTKTELGYQFDEKNFSLTPVFKLSGTATLANGTQAEITAYLPAVLQ